MKHNSYLVCKNSVLKKIDGLKCDGCDNDTFGRCRTDIVKMVNFAGDDEIIDAIVEVAKDFTYFCTKCGREYDG